MGTLGLPKTPLCSCCSTLPTKHFGAYGYGMETGEGEGKKKDQKEAFWQDIITKNWQDQQLFSITIQLSEINEYVQQSTCKKRM